MRMLHILTNAQGQDLCLLSTTGTIAVIFPVAAGVRGNSAPVASQTVSWLTSPLHPGRLWDQFNASGIFVPVAL